VVAADDARHVEEDVARHVEEDVARERRRRKEDA